MIFFKFFESRGGFLVSRLEVVLVSYILRVFVRFIIGWERFLFEVFYLGVVVSIFMLGVVFFIFSF